jgi:hypothetical protein
MFMPLLILATSSLRAAAAPAALYTQLADPATFILTVPEAMLLFGSQAIAFLAYGAWLQTQHTRQINAIRAENTQRVKEAEERAIQAEARARDAEKRMQARLDFVMDFYVRNSPALAHQPSTVQADGQVLDVLMDRFDMEELQTLAYELGVKWDSLAGDSAPTRAMHLVQHMRNTDRMRDLIDAIKHRRPGVFK